MDTSQLLVDGFGRVREAVHRVLDGASEPVLSFRVDPAANSVAWLIWHLTRVQDDHVAGVAGTPQEWIDGGWHERFGLPLKPHDTGYGHDPVQVAAVRADAALLRGYHDAVHEHTISYVHDLSGADLDRVVDTSWDPPVTLGTRLVSVLSDDLQHVGQAALVRGVAERR